MWKSRSEPEKPLTTTPQPPAPSAPAITPKEMRPMETPKTDNFRAEVAHIGKTVLVKGTVGHEDLYLDGGWKAHRAARPQPVIGPHGKVRPHPRQRRGGARR
jgi:hypothetical protein